MYEIGMPKPRYEGQEAEKYWQVMAQIEYAEEMGFDYTWAVARVIGCGIPPQASALFGLNNVGALFAGGRADRG